MKQSKIIARLFVTSAVMGTMVLSDIGSHKTTIVNGFSNILSVCFPVEAAPTNLAIPRSFVDKVYTENNLFKLASATDDEDRGDDEPDDDSDDKKDDKGGGGWDRIWDCSQLG
jgi:hypothetical protein